MSLSFGPFVLDADSRQLFQNGVEVRLTPKAFELLRLLAGERPRAISKAELSEHLWPGVHVTDDGLPRLVSEVRSALGDSARDPKWIRTVHGYGYAFAGVTDAHTGSFDAGCRLTWASREFKLTDGVHIIGRDPAAGICLEASVISRHHARIVVSHGDVRIEDLDSKNGTYIGTERLTSPHSLQDGEEIRIGDFTLTFRAVPALATETRIQ
jgi:DNA-binding winged helix-turn-helix (wHTH) protein